MDCLCGYVNNAEKYAVSELETIAQIVTSNLYVKIEQLLQDKINGVVVDNILDNIISSSNITS